MFRTIRVILGFSAVGGALALVVVGLVTGFFARAVTAVSGFWDGFVGWITSPLSFEHVLVGLGVLAVPLLILLIVFAVADE